MNDYEQNWSVPSKDKRVLKEKEIVNMLKY